MLRSDVSPCLLEIRNNEDLLCFKGWKGKAARPTVAWSLGMGNIQKFGVCRARRPVKIWCNTLGDRLFGERSHKGLKALRDAILGTQAKNSLGLAEHKIEGHFPSHRPSAACAEPWTNIIWSLVWGHFHSHVAVSSKASPTGVWKKVWPLFLDYVSIWEFGHVMGRVTGARQRYWTFYSNSLKSWKFKPLVLCGITKYDNICPLGLWSNPTDYYIQDMCICE